MQERLLSRMLALLPHAAKKMFPVLYIIAMMICGAAYGQPSMVSLIPKGSKNFVNVNWTLYFSSADSLF